MSFGTKFFIFVLENGGLTVPSSTMFRKRHHLKVRDVHRHRPPRVSGPRTEVGVCRPNFPTKPRSTTGDPTRSTRGGTRGGRPSSVGEGDGHAGRGPVQSRYRRDLYFQGAGTSRGSWWTHAGTLSYWCRGAGPPTIPARTQGPGQCQVRRLG